MLRTLLALLVVCAFSFHLPAARADDEEPTKKLPVPAVPVDMGGSLIPAGRLVIEPSITYANYTRDKVSISGFTIFEAILIGNIDVGRTKENIFTSSLALRYGLKDLELSTKIPYMFRTDDNSFPTGSSVSHFTANDSDLGDIEMAAFYHLLSEGPTRPDIVVGVTGKSNTGRDPYNLKTVAVDNSQPQYVQFATGSGHWGVSGTAIFVKTSDPAVLFLNTTYYYNFARDVGGVWGEINPGNSVEYAFGLVLGLNEKLAVNFSLDHRITWDTKQNGQVLKDTGANAAVANFGITFAFSRELSIDVVTGLGLTDDAPDFTIGVRLPITLFFK